MFHRTLPSKPSGLHRHRTGSVSPLPSDLIDHRDEIQRRMLTVTFWAPCIMFPEAGRPQLIVCTVLPCGSCEAIFLSILTAQE